MCGTVAGFNVLRLLDVLIFLRHDGFLYFSIIFTTEFTPFLKSLCVSLCACETIHWGQDVHRKSGKNLGISEDVLISKTDIYIFISAVKQLITINHIQNKRFCLHNMCVYCVYLLNTHKCMYTFQKNLVYILNIFIYSINYVNINIDM